MIHCGQISNNSPFASSSASMWSPGFTYEPETLLSQTVGTILMSAEELMPRLLHLVGAIAGRLSGRCLGLVQVWAPALLSSVHDDIGNTQRVVFTCKGLPFAIGEAQFRNFRLRSCQSGITMETLGLLSKVSTGAIQVVQNVSAIPSDVHPRNKLNGRLHPVGELVYIPIYDRLQPQAGLVGILEILLPASVSQTMLLADMISLVSATMETCQLSLSGPSGPTVHHGSPPGSSRNSPAPRFGAEEAFLPPARSMSRSTSIRGSLADLLPDPLASATDSSPSPTPPAKRMLSLM